MPKISEGNDLPPISIMVKPVSGACNLRCRYCFYADVASRRETANFGVMSKKTLDDLVRRAFAYADGEISFAFQGGEPTLAGIDFYREFLGLERRYNTRGLKITNAIQTNCFNIDDEWIKLFRDGNFLVGVSLDGTRELHDSCRLDAAGGKTFDRVLENIGLLRGGKVEYNILCVVNGGIAKRPNEVFDTLREHRYLQFIPCLDGFDGGTNEWSLDAEDYGRFLVGLFDRYEAAWKCGSPVSIRIFDNWIGMLLGEPPENCALAGFCGKYFLVEADGSVYPCDFYVLDKWKMGNVRESSFFRLANSEISEKFGNESKILHPDCENCKWYFICRGGCKRDCEPVCGGKRSANRLCKGHKIFFEERFDRMLAMAKKIAGGVNL